MRLHFQLILFPEMVWKCFAFEVFPAFLSDQSGSGIPCNLYCSFGGNSCSIRTGTVGNPRKTASAIRIFVSNHCSWIVVGFILYQFLILTFRLPVMASLLAGHFLVTLPYVIRVVGSAMEQFDFSIEEAAWSLGCPKGAAFLKWFSPM